ncbi:MAG TPA: folylpolyglutamate synthase/dihydrofolate synthase family protein [Bryobacteraceae bacterium]|jgi:dihydrofolate synthase/folylpolyglutamate synthase|nr:folylpolyglutamate synthase/dihydrofolate synthase family protein [Bryobacteraceae bacterium]
MNYPDSVHFLYALGNEIKTAKLGLERIRAVLEALGRPQDRLHFVHVAGTNGKGSICAMLDSALRSGGRRTGLFTSPHLAEPTERIRIDGVPVTAERFAAAFDRVHACVEGLIAAGEIDMHTTYFETVTAMALTVFEEERVDMVVFEVGLGGRLDATNVVIPDLAVIAPIDFDHEAYLGTSLDAIAREKAGILKPGVPAVFARQRPEAARVLEARLIDAQWSEHWPVRNLEVDARGSSFRLEDLTIRCPLAGEHQVENALTATLALRRLGIAKAAIEAGIAGAQWPGRLERVSEQPEIILDGAHNPAGARALAAYIERFYAGRRIRLIYGAMRDKAVAEISGILFPLADEVTLTAPRQARAMAPEMLREIAEHPNMRIAPDIETALGSAGEGVTFVTGSLFLVAEARAAIIGTKR